MEEYDGPSNSINDSEDPIIVLLLLTIVISYPPSLDTLNINQTEKI